MANRLQSVAKHVGSTPKVDLKSTDPLPRGNLAPITNAVKMLFLDEALSEDDAAMLSQTRRQIEAHRTYFRATKTEREAVKEEFLALARSMGPAGCQINGYGCAGLSNLQALLKTIEAYRYDGSFGTFYAVHNGLAMPSIDVAADEKQRKFFLSSMSNYGKIGAFALTEPEQGSDAASLNTVAKKVPGGWILNGRKKWIGNGTWADYVVVWARSDVTGGIAAFVVEQENSGFYSRRISDKITILDVENAYIELNDCFVTDSAKLPYEGFGGRTAAVLEKSRAGIAAAAVGVLLAAFERSMDYCMDRVQFGRPLAGHQLVQEKLMRVLGMLESSYLQVIHMGKMMDEGKAGMGMIALTKAHATRTLREGVSLCREVMGGNGVLTSYGVAKPFMDAEALYTYEGTYEVNILLAGRFFTGLNAIHSKSASSE